MEPMTLSEPAALPVLETDFLVVGGGITGLAFAAQIPDRDYLLCEADAELGGYCKTIKQDGFVWDYSGHFFHFRHKEIEEQLVSRIGKETVRQIARQSRIHYAGHLIDFPFQRNIHQLPQAEFIDCLVALFERPSAAPQNFLQMLYTKFGSGIADKFLVPYNEKLYATDLNRLDVDAMGRFFPHANVEEIIRGFRGDNSGSYNSTFTYPEGGAIEYVNAIAQDVRPERIRLNNRVVAVDLARKLAHTSSAQIRFNTLVSAAPFPKLLELCGMPAPSSVYAHNQVLVFNLGFDRKGPEGVHWIYYPQRDVSFYRVGFYDNIFNTPRMSMYVELGFPSSAALGPKEISSAQDQVLLDLQKVGLIAGHQLVSRHHVILDPAYVHITQASLKDVREKKAELAEHGVYSIGRYGSWTYCSIEDNIVEARELASALTSTGG